MKTQIEKIKENEGIKLNYIVHPIGKIRRLRKLGNPQIPTMPIDKDFVLEIKKPEIKIGQEISSRCKNDLDKFKCVFACWDGNTLQFDILPRNKQQEKEIGNGQYAWVAIDNLRHTGWAEKDNLIIIQNK